MPFTCSACCSNLAFILTPVYKAWCQDNNNGYAKTAREFREELAAHLGTTFKEMSVQRRQGTFYKDYTLAEDAMRQYAMGYICDDTDFLK